MRGWNFKRGNYESHKAAGDIAQQNLPPLLTAGFQSFTAALLIISQLMPLKNANVSRSVTIPNHGFTPFESPKAKSKNF